MYLVLHSRMMGQAMGNAQRMASQMFESQKSQLDTSIRQTYEAKLGEWKATTLAQAIEENRADAVDTSRAVLKGKIAEQMAPLLPGFLAKYNPADARFIGSPIDYLIFRNMRRGRFGRPYRDLVSGCQDGERGAEPCSEENRGSGGREES